MSPLLSAVLSFLFVIGLLLGTLWFVKSRGIGMGSTLGPGLRVVNSLRLGPKHRLDVVEYAGRRLLLGVAPNAISLLDAQDQHQQASSATPSQPTEQIADDSVKASFAGQLRDFMQRDQ